MALPKRLKRVVNLASTSLHLYVRMDVRGGLVHNNTNKFDALWLSFIYNYLKLLASCCPGQYLTMVILDGKLITS